jgi:RimJ/RimL family protein N-acetyltransferase
LQHDDEQADGVGIVGDLGGRGAPSTIGSPSPRSPGPPRIVLDDGYVLTGWLPRDAAVHRRLAVDPDAARFFGWTAEEAHTAPDSHYTDVIRRFGADWQAGTRFSLAIRCAADDVAVGAVELRPTADEADVSYTVAAELRGRGVAPRALQALLAWGARELGLRHATLTCHVDNVASRRVAEKCGFILMGRHGDDLRFRRAIP